jgi:DNA invertase Pin-like site-specific DNA recombinase
MALAFSYVRFSSPRQAEGDSLKRQTAAAAAWCKRNEATLDRATTLHDLGKSAFTGAHRTNADRHALAGFLRLVEQGRVPAGSFLIVEALDRLSREHIRPALSLLLSLIDAGVRVVQLKPVEVIYDDKVEPMTLMMALMELSRGHSESAVKSDRCGSAWAAKKKAAREEGVVITRRLPAWVELRHGGKLALIEERAAVIRRVFGWAEEGLGMKAIIRRLTEAKVPAWGRRGTWQKSYLALLLSDRRVLGEFQPRFRDGKPDGDAIPNYLPRVIDDAQWEAVRAGAAGRLHQGAERVSRVNVFRGLIYDAHDGGTYTTTLSYGRTGRGRRVLATSASQTGRGERRSFPFDVFEEAVLSLLREVDPRDVVGRKKGADPVLALSAERERVAAKIAELQAELLDGDVKAIAAVLRAQEARLGDIDARLAVARREAAHPLSFAWGNLTTLLDVVRSAPDPEEVRLRLKSELRRVVKRIDLLVVPRGLARLAAVQIHFAGDGRRDYLIVSKPSHRTFGGVRPGGWHAVSLPPAVAGRLELDLRKPGHARDLAAALESADIADLTGNE